MARIAAIYSAVNERPALASAAWMPLSASAPALSRAAARANSISVSSSRICAVCVTRTRSLLSQLCKGLSQDNRIARKEPREG